MSFEDAFAQMAKDQEALAEVYEFEGTLGDGLEHDRYSNSEMTDYSIPTRESVIMELVLVVITMSIIGILISRKFKKGARNEL